MGTDNIKNNDNLEDQFKLQVIKKNDLKESRLDVE